MQPTRPSFGPTSPMVGGPYVANQMQAGVTGTPLQGPQSPGFVPQTQAQPLPGSLPSKMGIPQIMQPMNPAPGMQQLQKPSNPKSEHELILEALSSRLKHLSDLEKRVIESHLEQNAK